MAAFDSYRVNNHARYMKERPNVLAESEKKYKMSRNKRTAIIFNHNKFKHYGNNQPATKPATEKDVERLKDVLSKLHFDVAVYQDYTHSQILAKFTQILHKKDFSDEDCFAIFILTRGNATKIAAQDTYYEPDELLYFFDENNCKTLAGKPKLIFINACRDDDQDYGVKFDTALIIDGPETPCNTIYQIPNMADILVAYSISKDYLSNRDEKLGTWFIQSLCDNLDSDEIGKKELTQILTITSRQMASKVGTKTNITQVPTIVSTLIRDLYLQEQE